MGFGLVAKTGYIGFGVGWEGKISHVQNVASVAGLGLFFFSSLFSFALLLQNRLRWTGSSWTGLNGCPSRLDTLRYPQHSYIHKCYCHRRSTTKKKRWYQKNGLGATGEFFYMKGYWGFCFSYESFLSLFVWVSLGWSGIDFLHLGHIFFCFSVTGYCVVYALTPSCVVYTCGVKFVWGFPMFSRFIPRWFFPRVLSL